MSASRPAGELPVQTRRPVLVILLASQLCLAAGCGGEPDAPGTAAGPVAVADTVDGIPRLTWPQTPFPELAWRLDTLLVIGGFDSDGSAFQFDQVEPGGIAGDSSGRLFVLDGAGKRVLGFGPDGTPTGTWGREGGGPGEFNSPAGLAVGPGDSLWVVDRGNRRITLFPLDPEGTPSDLALTDESSGLAGELSAGPDGVTGVAMIFSFQRNFGFNLFRPVLYVNEGVFQHPYHTIG